MFRSVGGANPPRWEGVAGHRSLNNADRADFLWEPLKNTNMYVILLLQQVRLVCNVIISCSFLSNGYIFDYFNKVLLIVMDQRM